jgi:predicted RNA methylase
MKEFILRALRRHMPQKIRAIPRIYLGKIEDRIRGIKTEGWYQLKKEDLSTMQCPDGHMYQPTTYRFLRKIIRKIPFEKSDVFIDLGCGKGRVVVFVAQNRCIKKAIGIEIVPELVSIARKNVESIPLPTPTEIIQDDVAKADLSQGTIYFLYDPFGQETIRIILDKIRKSLDMNPRIIRIVYFNMAMKDLLDECSWLAEEKRIADRIGVWRNIGL